MADENTNKNLDTNSDAESSGTDTSSAGSSTSASASSAQASSPSKKTSTRRKSSSRSSGASKASASSASSVSAPSAAASAPSKSPSPAKPTVKKPRKPAAKPSAPISRKGAGKAPINIQKLTEQRLLDTKLIRPESDRMSKVVIVSLLVGILAGGVILGVLFFSQSDLLNFTDRESDEIPNIDLGDLELIPTPGETEEETGEPEVVEEESTPPTEAVQVVEILDTPTGYLNVRSGPATSFEQVARVNPGEEYELISVDSDAGWYEIRLDENRTGWVINQYATVR